MHSFIAELHQRKICFRLDSVRENAVTIQIATPGKRWEIDFHENGEIEVEVFSSSGAIKDSTALESLLNM